MDILSTTQCPLCGLACVLEVGEDTRSTECSVCGYNILELLVHDEEWRTIVVNPGGFGTVTVQLPEGYVSVTNLRSLRHRDELLDMLRSDSERYARVFYTEFHEGEWREVSVIGPSSSSGAEAGGGTSDPQSDLRGA